MSSELGALNNRDIFVSCCEHFDDPKDIVQLGRVCQEYHRWSKDPVIWRVVSAREGIPLVANLDGTPRTNMDQDYGALYKITLSAKTIGELFGKVVGSVPPISQFWFDMLQQPDPYAEQKLFRDNYVFVVDPSFIERKVDKRTPLDLDASGMLITAADDQVVERTLTIPFSVKNLRMLSQYPLRGTGPVFNNDSCWNPVFDQITTYPMSVGIHVMRRDILEQSGDLPYAQQEQLVKQSSLGLTSTPLRIRALADAIWILTTRSCPDRWDMIESNYACCPDTVTYRGDQYQAIIGSFASRRGLSVDGNNSGLVRGGVAAVVPGAPAEVSLPLAFGKLSLDDGH